MDNEERFRSLLPKRFETMEQEPPFHAWLGGRIVDVDPGHVVVEYTIREEMGNSIGFMHGGAIAAMMDNVIGMAAVTTEGIDTFNTVDLHINYLSPAKVGDTILVEAQIVRQGSRILYAEAQMRGEGARVIAKAFSNMILEPGNSE